MTQGIRLILVRHGNTFEADETPVQVGSRTDKPLTEQGKRQAEEVAHYLLAESIRPTAIYAGHLKRQTETAGIIAHRLDIESKVHCNEPALTEIDYGRWEGMVAEEMREGWPDAYRAWTTQAVWADGIFGSSEQAHLTAIRSWLENLRRTYASGETVVGITSNGIIRYFASFEAERWNRLVNEGAMESLKVKTGNLCELSLTPSGLTVLKWNVSPKVVR